MAQLLTPSQVISQFAATHSVSSVPLGWRGLVVSHTARRATRNHRVAAMRDHVVHLRLEGANHLESRIAGETLRGWITPGSLIVSPAGSDMAWTWNRSCTTLDIFVEAALVDEAAAAIGGDRGGRTALAPRVGIRDPLMEGLGRLLADELASGAAVTALAESAALVLAGHLARRYAAAPGPRAQRTLPRETLSPAALRRVCDLIEASLGADVTLAALAAEARLSRFHFARGFRAATGTTPLQYVQLRRIEHAKRLLRNQRLSIIDVAAQVGFAGPEHFSNVFRRHTGLPPGRFRRQARD